MPARKLSLVMAVLLILAGCAPGPTPEPSTTPEEPRPCFVFHIPKEQADQAHGYADALVAELILAVEDETGNSLCESGALYEAVPHPGSDNEVDFVHTRGVGIDSLVLVTGIDAETGKLAYDVFPPPDELSADMERDVESAPFSYHEDEGEFALDINRTDGTLIHYDLFYDSDLGWIWSRENASALKLSSGPVERRAIRIQPMASEVLGLDEIRNFVLALRDNPAIEAYDDEPREAWLGWSIGMYQDAAGENHLILVKEGLDEQGQTVAQQAFWLVTGGEDKGGKTNEVQSLPALILNEQGVWVEAVDTEMQEWYEQFRWVGEEWDLGQVSVQMVIAEDVPRIGSIIIADNKDIVQGMLEDSLNRLKERESDDEDDKYAMITPQYIEEWEEAMDLLLENHVDTWASSALEGAILTALDAAQNSSEKDLRDFADSAREKGLIMVYYGGEVNSKVNYPPAEIMEEGDVVGWIEQIPTNGMINRHFIGYARDGTPMVLMGSRERWMINSTGGVDLNELPKTGRSYRELGEMLQATHFCPHIWFCQRAFPICGG